MNSDPEVLVFMFALCAVTDASDVKFDEKYLTRMILPHYTYRDERGNFIAKSEEVDKKYKTPFNSKRWLLFRPTPRALSSTKQ